MPGQLFIDEQQIYFTEIKKGRFEKNKFSSYANFILDFCQRYLNNKPEFQITTSGSTGLPKALRLDRDQMQASAHMTGRSLNINKSINALLCINATYIGGIMMLVRAMEFEWNLTVLDPKANIYHSSLPNFHFMALVPLQLAEIAANPEATNWAQQASMIIVGGAPVDLGLEAKIRLWTVPVYLTFGMTETVSHIALRCITGSSQSQFYSLLSGVAMKTDDRGCLMLKSKVTKNLWVTTNDLVEVKDKEHFRWLGRADNVINSGGHKVIPEVVEKEISAVLINQGISNDFFVAGLSDPKLGQKVTLIIEGESRDLLKIIQVNLKDKCHPYEIPRSILFIEQFSRTRNQKIQRKSTLREA
ncbi:MAG: AMP-binding protein [Cyclobacteriaceae bacterium]